MRLTQYGRDVWLSALFIALALDAIVAAVCCLMNICLCSALPISLWIFISVCWLAAAAFFRDPARKIPDDTSLVVSPADGTVRDIELFDADKLECEEMRRLFQGVKVLRIGIFLSVFSVHVNRAPAAMKITLKHYKKGAFHDARDGRAITENEAMTIGGTAEMNGIAFPCAVRQISGAIARRIVCPVEINTELSRGELYGMIKFGSRTELFLPADKFDVSVKIGDGVCGGSSVLAKIRTATPEQ